MLTVEIVFVIPTFTYGGHKKNVFGMILVHRERAGVLLSEVSMAENMLSLTVSFRKSKFA